jgi:hypothetical protein
LAIILILWLRCKAFASFGRTRVSHIAFGLLYPYLGFAGESTSAQFNTSLIVSLSGTKLIDNPIQPATSMLYWAFSIEKLLASLFFAMILVSIGRTVIR